MPKRYEKCVASFLVPFIDKWRESFCSSPGSTPKFILPFPLGIPEKISHPTPTPCCCLGFCYQISSPLMCGLMPRTRTSTSEGQSLRAQAQRASPPPPNLQGLKSLLIRLTLVLAWCRLSKDSEGVQKLPVGAFSPKN